MGFSLNPLGVLLDSRAQYRLPLSKSKNIFWKSTKLDAGLANEWTPADDFLGLRVTLEPIAFFDITLRGGYYGMFNVFGYGYYPMATATSDYGDSARKAIHPASVNGWWCSAAPEIKVKLGRFIAVDCVTANYFDMKSSGYFLEIHSWALHKTEDVDVQDDAYALVEINKMVMSGLNYHTLSVLGTKVFSDRLSAMAIIQPEWKTFESNFLAVMAGLYFRDPQFRGKGYFAIQAGFELKVK
ncbi:MAG TPA: hypothetical protein VLX68_17515 [Chitinivibrionales bacterium]|nr:hypothetical protein [Chitinivibrionales bacterium]